MLQKTSKHIRKPAWIRSHWPCNPEIDALKKMLRTQKLATVCEEAACPNLGECFGCGVATFMLMGNICTRNCNFCNVQSGVPKPLDVDEPANLAITVEKLQLKYVVLTSVTRDDLADGGAMHFTKCIQALHAQNLNLKIEILVPDFRKQQLDALKILGQANYHVFNHNIETVPRLYPTVRPSANYRSSLTLLKLHKELYPKIPTKSGIMLGLGETYEEIIEVLKDLRINKVDMLTLGQYLQPTKQHLEVQQYVTPEKFQELAAIAKQLGFTSVASAPLVRSSYHANTFFSQE